MAYASILDDRAVIALSGPDVRDFLQGLITNDMASCISDCALYAALLTPQGKIAAGPRAHGDGGPEMVR